MESYIMLLTADILLALNFGINNVYCKKVGSSVKSSLVFSFLLCVFTALIFLIYNGFNFAYTPFSILISLLLCLFVDGYTIIGFKIMRYQGMALYTLFLTAGGMIVPYIYGILFLNEAVSALRIIGLFVIVAGVYFSNTGTSKPSKKTVFLCVIVFFLNGFSSVANKIHGIEQVYETVTPSQLVVLCHSVRAVVLLVIFFFMKDTGKKMVLEKKPSKILFLFILLPILSALANGFSSTLQLTGAQTINASVLYPFITGGTIVFSSLTGWLFFREKLTKNKVLGVVLAFLGTLMFL